MGISLRPENLKRFKDIAVLLIKYGRSDLIKTTSFEETILNDEDLSADRLVAPSADELAKDLEAFQKIANRITVGLVIAALIVGAALLTRVETTFRIFGYPGLAMIFFLIAAFMGFWLVINILFYDKSSGD